MLLVELVQQDRAYPKAVERKLSSESCLQCGLPLVLLAPLPAHSQSLAGHHCSMPAGSGDECVKVLHAR